MAEKNHVGDNSFYYFEYAVALQDSKPRGQLLLEEIPPANGGRRGFAADRAFCDSRKWLLPDGS